MSEPNKPTINPNNTENIMNDITKLFFIIYLSLDDIDYIEKLKNTIHERHIDKWKSTPLIFMSREKKKTIAKIYWAFIILKVQSESKEWVKIKYKFIPAAEKRQGYWMPTFHLGDFQMRYRSDKSMKGFAEYKLQQLNNSNIGEK